MVNHLGFDQGDHALTVAGEVVAFEGPTFGFKLFLGAEEVRVVGHVEHPHEA